MPLTFADFHFHSKYSRAVSMAMNPEGLNEGALQKGLGVIGTGDFTHPAYFKELKSKLVEVGDSGLYKLSTRSQSPVLYTITVEVATFDGPKRVHHVIHAPNLEAAGQLSDVLSKRGNLAADGRPMFASTAGAEIVELCMGVDKRFLIYPAHAWTPWFGVLGSNGGYDSVEACYGDQSKNVFALETGMSSDPAMNWRISKLDKFTLLSNSDAHSNHPWRLGRECNAFSIPPEKLSYQSIYDAIRLKDGLAYTVEVDPGYGKYHYDGHRLCSFSCGPQETAKLNGRCPVCKRPLTIGVETRVEQLADRPVGFLPKNAVPFKKLLPLHELIAAVYSTSLSSQKVMAAGDALMKAFGNELSVLIDVPEAELAKHCHEKIAAAIILNREGKLAVKPGFDGEYGVLQLTAEQKLGEKKERAPREPKEEPQKTLGEY